MIGALEPQKLRRIVFATSAGTIFEAYDFILFGSLAPIISAQFFSGINETAAFIMVLLTFAAGYLVRPIGALFFGSLGDRKGRRTAFLFTITMMGAATFAMGLLPNYERAGMLAPTLLIVLRLVQGLAFGGEQSGAVVYTAEHAPPGKRGLYVGCIQAAAGFALFLSFFIIYVTRTVLGEQSFEEWGWRVPFLVSVVLLVVALWIRMTLEESPLFQRMQAEGKAAKRPLRETFGEWRNLRLVILVLLGLMMLQGVVFYTAHFYSQFFITEILKLPSATMSLIMMVVTFCSVPLYVLFSWMSDQMGRKSLVLLGAGLTLVIMLPVFHGFTAVVNPALAIAQERAPVTVVADQDECSLQFDPVGQAQFVSSCDIAKSTLTSLGVSYRNVAAPSGALAEVHVDGQVVQSVDGTPLFGEALATARAQFSALLNEALASAGYPIGAVATNVNLPLLGALILILILLSTLVYSLTPLMALELFPTRIRYSGLALPFHIGSGWFGGFLPAIAFSMVAANGSMYFGLWYPMAIISISLVVLIFFLPDTRGHDLYR